jgi:hypothetical protein
LEYLKSLVEKDVIHDRKESTPVHDVYKFESRIGDVLVVNIFENGTVTLQGKPAYLYREALSLLSYCDRVLVDDIVKTLNVFHEVNIKIKDVRDEMKKLLPHSYSNLDEMILKLLSPSISLRKIDMPLEDYSCYAFPALRALEGYIKYLFGLRGIYVGHNFYMIFEKKKVCSNISAKIADSTYVEVLEELYNYLAGNRHVLFHTEQVLIGTTTLNDKYEADEIVNNVLNLIETSYIRINEV